MEKKFKIGDKVKVKENLELDKHYGEYDFCEDMMKYKGEIVTINKVTNSYYEIEEDKETFFWTDGMLDPTNTYFKGDK